MVGGSHAFAILNRFPQLIPGHPSDIIHLILINVKCVAGGFCYAANHQLACATTACSHRAMRNVLPACSPSAVTLTTKQSQAMSLSCTYGTAVAHVLYAYEMQ